MIGVFTLYIYIYIIYSRAETGCYMLLLVFVLKSTDYALYWSHKANPFHTLYTDMDTHRYLYVSEPNS